MIKEVGIFINGILLINRGCNSYEASYEAAKLDNSLVCSLISALEIFFSTIFSQELEYVKGERSVLIFSKNTIKCSKNSDIHHIIAYIIIENSRRDIDTYITNIIRPKLELLLLKFRNRYSHSDFNETHRFQKFRKEIDKIFAEV